MVVVKRKNSAAQTNPKTNRVQNTVIIPVTLRFYGDGNTSSSI